MGEKSWRVEIICEDRRAERFFRRLCERLQIRVTRVEIAPAGKGDAADWVTARYPSEVSRRRSKNFQQNLGLLVHVDGDNLGVQATREKLKAALTGAGCAPRADDEPVALMIPTWSIETWLAALTGSPGVSEDEPLKQKAPHRQLWGDGATESATIKKAVAAWPGAGTLPSLAAAKVQGASIGLT